MRDQSSAVASTDQRLRRFLWPARALTLFFACWLGTAHLASALHFALVAHTVCSAHGELVHDDAHATPHAATPADAEASWRDASRDDHGLAHEHDHCLVGALSPAEASVAASPDVLAIAQPEPETRAPFTIVVPGRDRLYLLAPKTSPPPCGAPRIV